MWSDDHPAVTLPGGISGVSRFRPETGHFFIAQPLLVLETSE